MVHVYTGIYIYTCISVMSACVSVCCQLSASSGCLPFDLIPDIYAGHAGCVNTKPIDRRGVKKRKPVNGQGEAVKQVLIIPY